MTVQPDSGSSSTDTRRSPRERHSNGPTQSEIFFSLPRVVKAFKATAENWHGRRRNAIAQLKTVRGGWEGWAQVELYLAASRSIRIDREVPYGNIPGMDDTAKALSADFIISDPDGSSYVIELKCGGESSQSDVQKVFDAMGESGTLNLVFIMNITEERVILANVNHAHTLGY